MGGVLTGPPQVLDSIDPATCTGWSVTVTGPARVIGDEDDVAVLDLLPVEVWAPGDKETYIGIPLREVSGRRIRLPADHWRPSQWPFQT